MTEVAKVLAYIKADIKAMEAARATLQSGDETGQRAALTDLVTYGNDIGIATDKAVQRLESVKRKLVKFIQQVEANAVD
jgi:hypothetical protein